MKEGMGMARASFGHPIMPPPLMSEIQLSRSGSFRHNIGNNVVLSRHALPLRGVERRLVATHPSKGAGATGENEHHANAH